MDITWKIARRRKVSASYSGKGRNNSTLNAVRSIEKIYE
jgi:hypothetical protein